MAGGGLNDSMNSGKSPAGRVRHGVRAIVSNAAARQPISQTMRQQRNIIPVTIRQLQQAIAASPAEAATKDQPFQIDGRDCFVRANFEPVTVLHDHSSRSISRLWQSLPMQPQQRHTWH